MSTNTLEYANQLLAENERLKQQVLALAAENIALKHAMSMTLEHVSVTDAGNAGVAAMIINDALHNSETPATDAAIRELKAKGMDQFAAFQREWAAHWEKHGVSDGSASRALMVACEAEQLAASIRTGEV